MSFFGLFPKKQTSSNIAKTRLQFALQQDRAYCSTQDLERLKTAILQVIADFMEIDDSELDIHITESEEYGGAKGAPALYMNIPFSNMKKAKKK